MTTLLVSCSRRKRVLAGAGLRARGLSPGDVRAVAAAWNERIAGAKATTLASDLYCGRNFAEARLAADEAEARLLIASAGLGLVRADARVPSYDLTVTRGSEDDVLARIAPAAGGDAWWAALCAGAPRHTPLGDATTGEGLIVVALPMAYLKMLEPDLVALAPEDRARLRIISTASQPVVGEILRPFVLPYDDRLESLPGDRPGTRSDFVGRAARHFLRLLKADTGAGVEDHAQAVTRALAPYSARRTPVRTRMSDEDLLAALRQHWEAAGGRAGRLLRVLRDDLGLACEQSRFKELARQVREEMTA